MKNIPEYEHSSTNCSLFLVKELITPDSPNYKNDNEIVVDEDFDDTKIIIFSKMRKHSR